MLGAIALVCALWYVVRNMPAGEQFKEGVNQHLVTATVGFLALTIASAFLPNIVCGFQGIDATQMGDVAKPIANWGLVGSLALLLVFLTITLRKADLLKGVNNTSISAAVGLAGGFTLLAGLLISMATAPIDGIYGAADAANADYQLLMVIGGAVMATGLIWFVLSFACIGKKAAAPMNFVERR